MFQDSEFASPPQKGELLAGLKKNTGHMTWAWQPDQRAFVTDHLSTGVARVIADDIEGLDGRVSQQPQDDGHIRLVMTADDARDYNQRANSERAHFSRVQAVDHHLDYLQHTYPSVLWRPYEGGYVATGFTPAQREQLLKPFHKVGILPRDVDVASASDGPEQGVYVSTLQVDRLVRGTGQAMGH